MGTATYWDGEVDLFQIDISNDFRWNVPERFRDRMEIVCGDLQNRAGASPAMLFQSAIEDTTADIPLRQLITPGDCVAIAVDPSTPALLQILECLLKELKQLAADVDATRILLPAGCEDVANAIKAWMAASVDFGNVGVLLHDGQDRSSLSCLVANEEAEPLYIAKALADADVVIPLITAQKSSRRQSGHTARFFYDHFVTARPGDQSSQAIGSRRKSARASENDHRDRDAELVFWQLGILYGLVVAPGISGSAASIVGGSSARMDGAIRDIEIRWTVDPPAPASLVIAELSGAIDQQNWASAARALRNASTLVDPGGIIVLLTDLTKGSIQQAARKSKKSSLQRETNLGAEEFIAALSELRTSNGIFLKSQMTEELTEALGMGFVSSPAEIERLVGRQTRTIVIRDAQHILFRSGRPANSSK